MPGRSERTVHARIVYWGVPGAGVSTSLRLISTRLRPDHRGELQEIPTRVDPTVVYEVLPIKLGEIGGVDTRFEIVAVPGEAEHAPTRKQLLDRADGIVFVADARRERLAECVERFEELRRALSAYGRSLDSVPFVVQLNRSDLSDPAAREELLRKLDVPRSVVFEATAAAGQGVLQALSTISKNVVRALRERRTPTLPPAPSRPEGASQPGTPPRVVRPEPPPASKPTPAPLARPAPEALPATKAAQAPAAPAIHEDVTGRIDAPPPPAARPAARLRIVSVGEPVVQTDGAVRLPLDLTDEEGRRFQLSLTLALGPSPDRIGR